MKKLICMIPAILIVSVALIIILGSHSVATSAESYTPQKTYVSIEIRNNETLWGLAEDYAKDLQMNKAEYVQELKSINGLTSDRIIRGTHLIVMQAENAETAQLCEQRF